MLDKLGATPDGLVHVSANPAYDLRPAAVMGIENKVYVDRGFEPPTRVDQATASKRSPAA